MTSTTMTIADLIKYVDSLKQWLNVIQSSINRFESVKTVTRVVSNNESARVEEVSYPTVSVPELMSEYDTRAKELRLAQQALERANHTTEVSFTPKY
jgi:methyl-accepting chemotaxis protein